MKGAGHPFLLLGAKFIWQRKKDWLRPLRKFLGYGGIFSMVDYHPSTPPFSPCLKLQPGLKQHYKFTSLKHCVPWVKIQSTSQLWETKGERKRSLLTKSLLWRLSRSWWSPACFKWQKLGELSARNTLLVLPARFKPLPHHRAFVLLPEACPQATSSFLIKQLLCQWQQWLSPTAARGVAFCNTIWPPLAPVSSI